MAETNISKIEVSGKQFPVTEWKGERVLTLAIDHAADAYFARQVQGGAA